MTSSDPALIDTAIARTRAGEVDAFDDVVRACHLPLRCWLAGRCPPEVDPDEIAHLAFVTAFRSLAEYQAGTSFRSWLWTIARNQLLAQLTANRRLEAKRSGYLPDAVRQHLERHLQDRDDADDVYLAALRRCLARLAPMARTLVDRHYGEGFPLTAIAEEFNKTHGAVRKQLFTIRRTLRACIDDGGSAT